MAPAAAEDELVSALVDYVEADVYPTSEKVASADFPNIALPKLLDGIRRGQEQVKEELRTLSRGTAGDLDGWISQAKQLQRDISSSKSTARELLRDGDEVKRLRDIESDAASKADLLRRELQFNESLQGALEQLQIATGLLDKAKELERDNELVEAVREVENAKRVMMELDGLRESRFGVLVNKRAFVVKQDIQERVLRAWSLLVRVDHEQRRITVRESAEDNDESEIELWDIVNAMQELGVLEKHVSRLHRDLDGLVVQTRFARAADGMATSLHIEGDVMFTTGTVEEQGVAELARDVKALITFLKQHLPEQAAKLLLEKLLPHLLLHIVNDELDPSVPVAVDELVQYTPSLEHLQDLAAFVIDMGIDIPSEADLREWIERLPQNWLSRRREAALSSFRKRSQEAVLQQRAAERVETQMVSNDDVMVAGGPAADDEGWDEDWNEDDAESNVRSTAEATDEVKPKDEDEEVADGWGWGDDGEGENSKGKRGGRDDDDEDEDAAEGWGWGDETANTGPTTSTSPAQEKLSRTAATNGPQMQQHRPGQQEVTLRETFQITAIPDALIELINAVLQDAERIAAPSFPIEEIRAATAALSPISTLVLALYRATARTIYSSSPVADILIYNDSSELTTRLQGLLDDLSPSHPLARRLPKTIEAEIKNLHSFSRQAYGREMDSQRTILSDLLSGTAGFASCTNPLNAREYQSAVEDVVARIRDVDRMWKGVLCESARPQAMGSLLSHVIRRVVEDILELAGEPAGISEPESKQLKAYLDTIASLSDIFLVQSRQDSEPQTLIFAYTQSWLRFMYLGEILEASLADIKFLWLEGELSLEYEADEVVELVQALFAESEHRRGAIREIRRAAGGRRSIDQ